MSKKERLQRRVKRIDDRFKAKVAKGKKGTDTDIQDHEDRIKALADKGGFSAPFMARSPLNREVPNCVPRGKGKDKLSKPADDPCWENYVQRGMKEK